MNEQNYFFSLKMFYLLKASKLKLQNIDLKYQGFLSLQDAFLMSRFFCTRKQFIENFDQIRLQTNLRIVSRK